MKNTVICSGVAQRRVELGWSQQTFAEKSGYSVRLISKAENGKPISRTTAEDLADTLDVPIDSLVFSPVDSAKEFINAMHVSPDFFISKLPDFFHPNCVLNMSGPSKIPFSGTHYGIDGVIKCFTIFFDILEAPDHDHNACYEFSGFDDIAIVHGDSWIHPKGTPLTSPMHLILKFKFKDGKIIRLDDLFDTEKGVKVIFPDD